MKRMIIAIDTETQGLDCTKFILGAICFEDETYEIYTNREKMAKRIIDIIEKWARKGEKTKIYAHNMEYDFYTIFRGIWKDFSYISYPEPFIVMYKCPGKVKDKRTGKRETKESYFGSFHSTTDIFTMSLRRMGEITGLPKKEIPETLLQERREPREISYEESQRIADYCRNDAAIVMRSIKKVRDDIKKNFNISLRRFTTAGQIAMSTYITWATKNRPSFEEKTYWEQMANWNADERKWEMAKTRFPYQIRKAYRGGMNIAFQTGEFSNATMIDVNSLYGYIMATMRFPDLKREEFIKGNPGFMDYKGSLGFTQADVKIQWNGAGESGEEAGGEGVLPIKYNERLMFPSKRGLVMSSIWTNHELRLAEEAGYKIEHENYHILYPDLKENPFTEFVEKLYKLKQEPESKEIAKIMLNSLSGKFGQKGLKKRLEFIHRKEAYEWCKQGWQIEGELGENYAVSKVMQGKESYFVNPAIIAMITAGARVFLWKELQKIDKKDRLYCDTDSIIVRNFKDYEDRFEIGDRLGQWKIEFEDEKIVIKGEKKYMSESELKLSGAKKATKEEFLNGKVKQEKMVGLLEAMKTGKEAGMFRQEEMTIQTGSKKDIKIKEGRVLDL